MIVAMTIAGSDPSGGAGLQADLKTFHQHGVYGTSVVTLLTVQNTQKVESVEVLGPEFVVSQLDAVLDDIPPTAAKTGALGNAAVIEAIAERAERFSFPLVIDPVMVPQFQLVRIAQIMTFILFMGAVASIYPAIRAAKIDVAESMKFER